MKFNGEAFDKKLSNNENKKYIELAQQGDKQAKEIIVKHNLCLITSLINKYYKGFDEEIKTELFSVGCLGLWKAITYFDLSFNTEFSTYAVPMILGEIKRFIRNNNILHIPQNIQQLSKDITNIQKKYSDSYQLSYGEIAKILNIDENEVILAINSKLPVQSFQASKNLSQNDSEDISLENNIQDNNFVIYENIERKELYKDILNTLNNLTENEKTIIKLFFGIGCKPKTQIEIAKILKTSQPQVSKTKTKA